jgi:hypothetical protein
VADEPTNGELGRRLDDILRNVQSLVSQAQYGADQRRIDEQVAAVRRELTDARRELTEDVAGVRHDADESLRQVHQRITDEAKRAAESRQSWRTILYTGLIPALVVFLSILVQIWLHGSAK